MIIHTNCIRTNDNYNPQSTSGNNKFVHKEATFWTSTSNIHLNAASFVINMATTEQTRHNVQEFQVEIYESFALLPDYDPPSTGVYLH